MISILGNSSMSIDDIEQEISSMMVLTQEKLWLCTACGKESRYKTDISRHIDSKHIIDHPGYDCDLCGEHLKSKQALRRHVSLKHQHETLTYNYN